MHYYTCHYYTRTPQKIGVASTLSVGRFSEAEALYHANLEAKARNLGPDHVDTLMVEMNLAVCRKERGRFSSAEAALAHNLASKRRALGPDHQVHLLPPSLALSRHRMRTTAIYRHLPRFARACMRCPTGHVLRRARACRMLGRRRQHGQAGRGGGTGGAHSLDASPRLWRVASVGSERSDARGVGDAGPR